MDLGILGPLEVRVDGRPLEIGSPKLRTLLILLALEVGRAVPVDRLIDGLWPDAPPGRALVSLRSYISNLRKALVAAGADASVLATKGRGYAFDVDPEHVDAVRFEQRVTSARGLLHQGDPAGALQLLDEAAELWRGEALADVHYEEFAQATIARLEELRTSAEEDRAEALLALGRHLDAIPALEAQVANQPLRERPHAQLMLALYRAGRSPDALSLHRSFRDRLVDELGIEPSAGFASLFDRILRQDRDLELVPVPVAPDPDEGTEPRERSGLSPDDDAPLGRDEELEHFSRPIERAAHGHGGLVLVAGEAGIGKSTLVRQVASRAESEGFVTHWSRCDEADGMPPFWPWVQLLREVAARLDDDELRTIASDVARPVTQLVSEVADRLGERVDAAGPDPEMARFALYEAVATFLVRAARPRGMLLVIDDLHWADRASLQLLKFLSPRLGSSRVLLAGTYRSLPTDRSADLDDVLATVSRSPDAHLLTLSGLEIDTVARVLARLTGQDVDDVVVATIHEKTGGNPFFVRQLAQLLAETTSGALDPSDLPLPPGVRHVLRQRLQLVPDGPRRTLETAAVAGRDFDADVIAEALGRSLDDVLDHLDVAVDHGLVTGSDEDAVHFRFSHSLINETIYDELPPGRAARLHRAIGGALEQHGRADAADLAEHFWRAANLLDDDRALVFLRQAADEALAMFAYEQSEAYLRRALHLLSHRPALDPATELEVRLRLIHLLTSVYGWTTDKVHELVAPTRDIALQAGITSQLVPLWWSLWTLYTTRGDMVSSCELAETLATAAAANERGACHVAAHVALAYSALHSTGDADTALEHCRKAREAEAVADPRLLASTPEHLSVSLRVTESLALARGGREQQALEVADEAIALAREVGNAFTEAYSRMFAGWSAALIDDPTRALGYTEPALAICKELGFKYVADLATPVDGWARARLGSDPGLETQRVRAAVASLREVGHQHALAQWLLLLADVLLLAGDRAAAREELEAVEAVLGQTGERFYGPQVAALSARLSRSTAVS